MTQIHQRHPSVVKPFQEEYIDNKIKTHFFDVANTMRLKGNFLYFCVEDFRISLFFSGEENHIGISPVSSEDRKSVRLVLSESLVQNKQNLTLQSSETYLD